MLNYYVVRTMRKRFHETNEHGSMEIQGTKNIFAKD